MFPRVYNSVGPYTNGIPDVSIAGGITGWTGPAKTLIAPTTEIEANDTVSIVRGQHTLRVGVMIIRNRKDQNGRSPYDGIVAFNNSGNPNTTTYAFADALLGNYYTYTEAAYDPMGRYRFTEPAFFVHDSWKATRKLSLDLGLRSEYMMSMYSTMDNLSEFVPSRYNPAQAVRLDPTGNYLVTGVGNLYTVWCGGQRRQSQPGLSRPECQRPRGSLGSGRRAARDVSQPDHRSQPQDSLFAAVQPRHSARTAAQAVCTSHLRRHTLATSFGRAGHQPAVIRGPGIGSLHDGRHQHSSLRRLLHDPAIRKQGHLQLQCAATLSRPAHRQSHVTAGYTWSKNLGDASSDTTDHHDAFNARAFYGPLTFDVRHVLVGTFVLDLPALRNQKQYLHGPFGDWQLSGIIHLQSGMHYSITGNSKIVSGRLADYLGGPALLPNPGPNGWFNPAAFTAAPQDRWGTSGAGNVTGPGLQQYNIALTKFFRITERISLRARAEFINAFNCVNFQGPQVNSSDSTSAQSRRSTRPGISNWG